MHIRLIDKNFTGIFEKFRSFLRLQIYKYYNYPPPFYMLNVVNII